MRILHVIDSLSVGGAEKLVISLCAERKARSTPDEEPEIYVLRGAGRLTRQATRTGLRVHEASSGSVYSPMHVLRLASFLQGHHFDLIHVHLFPAQLWTVLAVMLASRQTPVVTTEHSTNNRRRNFIGRVLDRWMYSRFAAVAAISNATFESLRQHAGSSVSALRVVANGVVTEAFRPPTRRRALQNNIRLMVVGSLTSVKDQATAIRALVHCGAARLALVGDGPLRGELEQLACRLSVQDRVEFMGVRDDIPALLAEADIYIQTSRYEGFCLAAVEAMSSGLPCILSRVAGLQEVAADAALYFEPGDCLSLSRHIKAVAEHPGRADAMSVRSLERASLYSLKQCSSQYQELYSAAVASGVSQ